MAQPADSEYSAGLAKIDITPPGPIFLSGYGNRTIPSTGVVQRLWAKALAIRHKNDSPVVLLTVDNCGISDLMGNEVAARVERKGGPGRDHIVFFSTHTHAGPCLNGSLENLFSRDLSPAEKEPIKEYTQKLADQLEKAALQAIADLRPASLEWQEGKVRFARNRRPQGGPVDPALPVLKVVDWQGKTRGIFVSYSCHATTFGGDQVHGDWPGFAQEFMERDHPGAVAMVAIGCGADANPFPRGSLTNAIIHAESLAAEVKRLASQPMRSLHGLIQCRSKRIELSFQELPTREQWVERSQQKGIVGYHATKNLARLDRGETLPRTLSYLVQTLDFGGELALINLPGEVVVDYSLRLKKELNPDRVWVNGYANGVPCYIPSKRILNEGGYEAESSLWYYDHPARLSVETENQIVAAVHDLIPQKFKAPKTANFPDPKTPKEALTTFRLASELEIKLAASEPAVVDPVAIDFGADGKLWVAEMRDYPSGMDGAGKPGGRVKWLVDRDGDGLYETATVFLDEVPFPTGLMAWGKGVLVCAAPDILYAEDTNGDGKADRTQKLFTNFATHNFQARVNGLRWGLDNWVYGASGLFGGKINAVSAVNPQHRNFIGQTIDVSGRDFRMHPDSAEFEAVSGLSQQSRVRDDWGNWFGCDNSTLLWHFPLSEKYLRRNPFVRSPEPGIFPPAKNKSSDYDPNQLYPASKTLERFNDPSHENRVTSACGVEIYRAHALGDAFYGNAFVCEPVHNLVHRLVLSRDGISFSARRAPEEKDREFLASTDNWFRPVEVRTGPDGALWIVDMYRFVVEHPRWISPDRLKELNVRAGEDRGRIYRVVKKGSPQRQLTPPGKMGPSKLFAALNNSSGAFRDLVHRELLQQPNQVPELTKLFRTSADPAVKVQTLGILQGLQALSLEMVVQGLSNSHPEVITASLRASEGFLRQLPPANSPSARKTEQAFTNSLFRLTASPDPRVRYQLACSLGESPHPLAAECLFQVLSHGMEDRWIRGAVLSSARYHAGDLLQRLLATRQSTPAKKEVITDLVATIAGSEDPDQMRKAWKAVFPQTPGEAEAWQFDALNRFTEAFKNRTPSGGAEEFKNNFASEIISLQAAAKTIATNAMLDEFKRAAAVRFLGRDGNPATIEMMHQLSWKDSSPAVQSNALKSLTQSSNPALAERVLNLWSQYSPGHRSAFIKMLLSRPAWIEQVLDRIEAGEMVPNEIPLPAQQQLVAQQSTPLQKRAATIFGRKETSRRAILEGYKSIDPARGNAGRGAALFDSQCGACHFYRGRGHAVGPDLSPFRSKPVEDFVVAILDPNAAIEPRFMQYQVETWDGRSLAGIVQGETANGITLVQGSGVKDNIFRAEIKEMKASPLSLMPEGLEAALGVEQLNDLIAWLKSGEPPVFGSASTEKIQAARAEFIRNGGSSLVRVVEASESLEYPSWLGPLRMQACRQTAGVNRIRWTGKPAVRGDKKVFQFPAALGFISQPSGKFHFRIDGHEILEFDVVLNDQRWESSDGKVKLLYTVQEKNTEDSNGVLEVEISAGSSTHEEKPVLFEVFGSASSSQRWFGIYEVPKEVNDSQRY